MAAVDDLLQEWSARPGLEMPPGRRARPATACVFGGGRNIFGDDPLADRARRYGGVRFQGFTPARRALVVLLVGWAPLAVLSGIEGGYLAVPERGSFLSDVAVHGRFLIALPLFAFATALWIPRVTDTAWSFVDMGLISAPERPAFDEALESTRRLGGSLVARAAAIVLAYSCILGLLRWADAPWQSLPSWHFAADRPDRLSSAGWWHVLVSLPMLFVALFLLVWRWFLWTRLLWRISRLPLALVPPHPDGAAGLKFATYSVRACAPYGFLLGVIVAAPIASRILQGQAAVFEHLAVFIALLSIVAIVFCAPLLVFTTQLLGAWRRGVFEYDALADRMARTFEARWLGPDVDPSERDVQDFSAMADLNSVVSNVHGMNLFLLDVRGVALLLCATALPFLGVLLLSVPVDRILSVLAEVFLS